MCVCVCVFVYLCVCVFVYLCVCVDEENTKRKAHQQNDSKYKTHKHKGLTHTRDPCHSACHSLCFIPNNNHASFSPVVHICNHIRSVLWNQLQH